ncbi:hypothetical protein ABZ599_08085 [Streptomyces misionensis]|uniref:hypothetical protein n=1 Tax=Streptomyces misionensis TaxID=67331 RepID=UPI0033EE10F6
MSRVAARSRRPAERSARPGTGHGHRSGHHEPAVATGASGVLPGIRPAVAANTVLVLTAALIAAVFLADRTTD